MKYVPHWVIDALMSKKFKCHNCKKVFTHKNVRALGIRESVSDPGTESFFIELECVGCRKATFFEMQEMNIVELSEEIIAEIDADLDELEKNMPEFNEEDMFKDKKIDKSKENINKNVSKKPVDNKGKKKLSSKITLKDVREVKTLLKPGDFKHEDLLEMMGMSPEEISQYRGTE